MSDALRLPLWSASFWSKVHLELAPLKQKWADGIAWLQSPDLSPWAHVVEPLFRSLASLSWSGYISAGGPFGLVRFPKSILPAYLSKEWLTDEHVDQMICSLTENLQDRSTLLVDTVYSRLISRAYETKTYQPSNPNDVLSRFGSKISEASGLGGIFHSHGNHWVAAVVIPSEGRILFGDPAGGKPDPSIAEPLVWFCQQNDLHTPPIDEFIYETLPCPIQDLSIDSWNCAIFSQNALAHYLCSAETPLLEKTDRRGFGDAARLSFLSDILKDYNMSKPILSVSALPVQRADLNRFLESKTAIHTSRESQDAITKIRLPAAVPSSKKKSAKSTVKKPTQSCLAPIFQIPPLPQPSISSVPPSSTKRKLEDITNTVHLASFTHNNSLDISLGDSDSDSDDDTQCENPQKRGRPSLDYLDQLTVELPREHGRPRTHRCIGNGCQIKWRPRTAARVLAHSKKCLLLTPELRLLAARQSADLAPGSLVASDQARLKLSQSSSPASLSTPLTSSSSISSVSSETTLSSNLNDGFNWGPRGNKQIQHTADHIVVKLFCAARIPPAVADLPEWKELFRVFSRTYVPASRTKLFDSQIQSEEAFVKKQNIALLKKEKRLSLSFDGGSIRNGGSVYTVHATTQAKRVVLLEGQECTDVSHTGEWIAELVLRVSGFPSLCCEATDNNKQVIDEIGRHRFSAVSSDNTGNTRVAREKLTEQLPQVLNLPDPIHHLNNTCKDLCALEYFKPGTVKHFKHSNIGKEKLRKERVKQGLGAGLESAGKTRFASRIWCAVSLQRNLPALEVLCTNDEITIPDYHRYFIKNTPASLQFQIHLTQFIAVCDGLARGIQCLEAVSITPADIQLYWIAIVFRIKRALETCQLPDSVAQDIRRIINKRWRQFFIEGPTNVHLTAFYLHPDFVRSDILRQPNALAFTIQLPAAKDAPATVPPGIANPRTFSEVGKYLHHLLVIEVNHGSDDFLRQWKDKPATLIKLFKAQFTAYAQRTFPFALGLGPGQTPLEYWSTFEGSANGGILAALAIKLFSAVPHSMADERTMSSITMLNTAQRSRQKVDTVIAMTRIRSYYQAEKSIKLLPSTIQQLRRSARPHPVIRFFDVKRLRRGLDDDERDEDVNYDESDDEDFVPPNTSTTSMTPEVKASVELDSDTVLPEDSDTSEFNLASLDVQELLADGPIPRGRIPLPAVATKADLKCDEEEDDGSFDLGGWV
ncbi:hypothetical protein D9611_015136 [Ephemerocybe angulata]|uniref:Ubiquitin-like protease family profile domain-containing protein n=1 Tax=Ephemerocybe angulata TaxID=980116 RepID=A0A8H5F9H4_9AGAR|nr:hypothetical protein D9611_015136 [Tulosesus angulatus]